MMEMQVVGGAMVASFCAPVSQTSFTGWNAPRYDACLQLAARDGTYNAGVDALLAYLRERLGNLE
jgi:hypothetical protein